SMCERSANCHPRCFFFSSRRRHTRSKRDWSSDVCSSDLGGLGCAPPGAPAGRATYPTERTYPTMTFAYPNQGTCSRMTKIELARSEERRVGKEGRGGRWADGGRKKGEEAQADERTADVGR